MIEVLQFLLQLSLELLTFIFAINLGGVVIGAIVIYFFLLTITLKFLLFIINSDISMIRARSSTLQKKGGK